MPDFNVLDQIRKLVKLQEGDTDFYNLRKELQEKPILIEQLQKDFDAKKSHLSELENNFKKIQVGRGTLEGDLSQKEAEIEKSNAHLSQIKTNKEYTAKIGEIEGLKADQSIIEENILETYDRADEAKALIDQEKEVVAKAEEEFITKKKEIEAVIQDLEASVNELNAARASLLEGVDKDLLSRYEKILNNSSGLAVVPVVGDVCGGCFMNLPPQTINEITKKKEIICCERCTRILYSEDDLKNETV